VGPPPRHSQHKREGQHDTYSQQKDAKGDRHLLLGG
jgi:hypothetical protein